MKISVSNYPEIIEFELEKITQLCGQNIRKKQFAINSLAKYFSNEKYIGDDERIKDNICVDREQIGRNYFQIIRVSKKEDILNLIKLGKTTLLTQFIKDRLKDFYCESQMAYIEDKLTEIISSINMELELSIGNIALDFLPSDLWDIVQKTSVHSSNGDSINLKKPIELLQILVNLIIQNSKYSGNRKIILFENIDHMLSVSEYKLFLTEMEKYGDLYDIYILVTTSLDGYVYVTENTIDGITIFNTVIFSLPDIHRLLLFINENYPYYRIFNSSDLMNNIEKIVQKIGKSGYMIEDEEMTICKLLNDTMIKSEIRRNKENHMITAFLNGSYMV